MGKVEEKSRPLQQLHAELKQYFDLFRAAFDELHAATFKHVRTPGRYIGPHHDYPVMSFTEAGFPVFHETGFYNDSSPRDYVGTVRPRGLMGLLSGTNFADFQLTKGAELATFLRANSIGDRLVLNRLTFGGVASDRPVDELVSAAVERYFHRYGLAAPINPKLRDNIIRPLLYGTVFRQMKLLLIVPITMTLFDIDHYSLSETAYITKLPRTLQLARAQIQTYGSGAVKHVVGAATHAFVSNDWDLEVDNVPEVQASLNDVAPNVLDAVDSFFGALRIATGISTGYAQILWMPKRWALNYFCDLTPVFGTAIRQYPSEFDNYGWARPGATVSSSDLANISRIYKSIQMNSSEAVRLAIKRLNSCLTRTDAADAILDGTIGLELLLGDTDNQSLSYKLRVRAAALALLEFDSQRPAKDVARLVKQLYETRSAIVHGKRKRATKKASGPSDTIYQEDRARASDLLRYVLDMLLTHPQYQNPLQIDEGLLLRGNQ